MSSVELFDELEAGELAIQFEGEEPEALLAWAIEEFGDRLAISTSFQADSVALIDMAYEIDPEIKVFSVDTGMLPPETHELAQRLIERYPGLNLDLISPATGEVTKMTEKHGENLMFNAVDLRLLCCNVRKVRPLTKHLHGLDASLRRRGGRLLVRSGRPSEVVPQVTAEAGAGVVHANADVTKYGRSRDLAVCERLESTFNTWWEPWKAQRVAATENAASAAREDGVSEPNMAE